MTNTLRLAAAAAILALGCGRSSMGNPYGTDPIGDPIDDGLPGEGGFTGDGGFRGDGGFTGDGSFTGGGVAGRGGRGGTGGSGGRGGRGGRGGTAGAGGIGGVSAGGSGGGGPCAVDADCASSSSCLTPRCSGGFCTTELRDADADGYPDVRCGGEDCNDLNPFAYPGAEELCTDGSDNDCNGVADCDDPRCFGWFCGCRAFTEDCTDDADDDCDGAVDCNDPECAGTEVCGCTPSEGAACDNGVDDDCDGLTDCDDDECASGPACTCRSTPEACTGGVDDDCDGLVDCADPDCVASGACVCSPPGAPEACADAVDDDCDGLVDCQDPDCLHAPECSHCTQEDCGNGLDDDCNGAVDCADVGCRFYTGCAPTGEVCGNGLDDDRDSKTDCFDPDCASNPACVREHATCLSPEVITASGSYFGDTTGHVGESEGTCGGAAGEAVYRLVLTRATAVILDTVGSEFDTALYVRRGACTAGRELACDDDGGGVKWASKVTFPLLQPGSYYVFVDGYAVDATDGAEQGPYVLNVSLDGSPAEDCGNGTDDDGDRYADCADPDCQGLPRCAGCSPEFGIAACTDGVDDDCDGKIDCADPDCAASPLYPTECCDGVDTNDNGVPDDFACRCATDSECGADEICYSHTIDRCGPPCSTFVGDLCAVWAPGAVCNEATEQCEF